MSRRLLVALCVWLSWSAGSTLAQEVPSFVHEVVPILTRQGCNQGACHGKGAGQNGFRLSLRGYAPELDHRWLTREFSARRMVPSVPEHSLLLTKPTGQVPHEGGKLFSVGSREYQTLLAWIRAGAPGPSPHDLRLVSLELTPTHQVLQVDQTVQLRAIARFSDGSQRDVTWLTKFESNDAGQMAVSADGLVRAIRPGETTIRAAFQTEVAVALFTVPYPRNVDTSRFQPRHNFIDDAVFAKLQALRIEPSDLSSDAEFLRRVYLDTIGSLPTSAEACAFLADTSPTKRTKLIDDLLNRPEFIDYWTLQLGDLLQNRKERDHDVRGVKGVRSFHEWLRQQVANNRPWDQLARDVLTVRGNSRDHPAVGYFIVTVGEHREAERSEVVSAVAQTFLGTRIGCAQCHNHPLERYTQDDFYHFAGFFSRLKLERKEPRQGFTTLQVSAADDQRNKSPIGVRQPRTNEFLPPRPLDRSAMTVVPGEDPRQKLVQWMTDPTNEYFSGAMVNRIWKHYLGVGLVEPVDDLRATNPPSNPELWRALNREFVQHRFDLKHLMRVILQSRTYQLSSATRPGNESDQRFYSHYYARRLPAEVLLDAISQSTGVPDTFPGYPLGVRAVQIPDPGLKSYFLSLFGRSERVTACACERNGEVTMPQLLHLQNGENLLRKIADPDGRLQTLLQTQPDENQVLDEVFLSTLSRLPTDQERRTVRRWLAQGEPRAEVYRDLMWAILNSKNFSFNH